jgi:TolB-like protein
MFVAQVDDDNAPAPCQPEVVEAHQPVLAVLPFVNMTTEPGHEHVADGLTHDIITALSKHRWLRVLTRATAAGYAGQPDAAARMRDELGVDYMVEGRCASTTGGGSPPA